MRAAYLLDRLRVDHSRLAADDFVRRLAGLGKVDNVAGFHIYVYTHLRLTCRGNSRHA
jgi:hypothetical protein